MGCYAKPQEKLYLLKSVFSTSNICNSKMNHNCGNVIKFQNVFCDKGNIISCCFNNPLNVLMKFVSQKKPFSSCM